MAIEKELNKKQGLEQHIKQLREQLQEKKKKNENTKFFLQKTKNEANREEGYVVELNKGLKQMLVQYQNQFLELKEMVEKNNAAIELLRQESAQNIYFSLKAENETVEQTVELLKADKDLQISLQEKEKVERLKILEGETKKRIQVLQEQIENQLLQWEDKLDQLEEEIQEHLRNIEKPEIKALLTNLLERLEVRNEKIEEVRAQKEAIEQKLDRQAS